MMRDEKTKPTFINEKFELKFQKPLNTYGISERSVTSHYNTLVASLERARRSVKPLSYC